MMITRHLIVRYLVLIVVCFMIGVVTAQQPTEDLADPRINTLVDGLRNPVDLVVLPDGGILIAEEGTGNDDLSAGVSLRQPDGTVGRLISGLPSSRDAGDLSGVALVGISPDETTVYIGNFAQGHLWTLPVEQASTLPDTPLTTDDLGKAMLPFNRVQLTNPFDIAFDDNGVPVVSDSSQDGIAQELPDGRTQFIHRFPRLVNPTNDELRISPVPTGIERIEDEYYVTLTGGCPYPTNSGELVAVDDNRNQRTVVDDLTMPIDVAQDVDGTIWVLEFARFSTDGSCFSGTDYLPNTGRLSRLRDDGTLESVVENLNFPGAVEPLSDGSLYVVEVFDSEILHITFDDTVEDATDDAEETTIEAVLASLDIPEPAYNSIDDVDAALQRVITSRNLTANPGLTLAELQPADSQRVELGRDLFFDPILSGDENISCATCHHPAFAMADERVLPIGSGGVGLGNERDFLTHITLGKEYAADRPEVANPAIGHFVPRNSPTILNSALLPVQFWDGRVDNYSGIVNTLETNVNALQLTDSLAAQALFPVISRAEMAGNTFGEMEPPVIRRLIADRLMNVPAYRERFAAIYDTETITPTQIVDAIAAFERELIFTESDWDAYIGGNPYALTPQQKRGALLFYGELNPDVNCAACHSGDLLSDLDFHNLLVPQLGPGKGNGISRREDWGRANVTFDRRDQFQFRTPSLRNVELTAPYFHSGAYSTLEDTIRHHANIWESAANYDPSAHLPPEFYSSLRPFDAASQAHSVAPELADGLPLSNNDIDDLVAFLTSLTDPDARDLTHLTPDNVPSGLALDALPTDDTQASSLPDADTATNSTTPANDTNTSTWQFTNVAADVGLDFQHGAFQDDLYDDPAAMMGAGLCWIDYDSDGWLDLYLVNSYAEDEYDQLAAEDALPHNQLYRNTNGNFTPVDAGTQLTMRGNGCVAADFDLDGDTDLYITADGEDVLLQNQGDGTFTDHTAGSGLGASEWTSTAVVGDVNGDGLPDLFVGAYIDLENSIPNPIGAFPQDYYGLPDHLYLNRGVDDSGQLIFEDVTNAVGLEREERTLGAIFSDVDRDGDLDLYIANDGQPNRLHENISDDSAIGMHFADLTDTADVGDSGSGMGVTSADYDGDGYFDLFVTNWEAELNALYRNETPDEDLINFRYSTYRIGMMGLGRDMTGWGTTWADFDHDTDIDLLTVNGRVPVTNRTTDPELVRLYGNVLVEQGRPHYREWTERVGLDTVGTLLARGGAAADYDNDGDLDIAVNSISGHAALLRHSGTDGHWLRVRVEDFAPGTIVTVTLPDGRDLVREWHAGSSYLASEDPRLHFGVGDADTLSRVTVRFPDGTTQQRTAVATNQELSFTKSEE